MLALFVSSLVQDRRLKPNVWRRCEVVVVNSCDLTCQGSNMADIIQALYHDFSLLFL